MSLFDKLFNAKPGVKKDKHHYGKSIPPSPQSKLSVTQNKPTSSNQPVDRPSNNTSATIMHTLSVHPDIASLLWIADGPRKNYAPQAQRVETYSSSGIRLTVTFSGQEEPSLLSTRLPLTQVRDPHFIEHPPYYPTYDGLTPQQRSVYWKALENPYDPSLDVGYIFLLYYGLERHLLYGNTNQALSVILKLRNVHANNSFQSYSANAVVLYSLILNRPDLLMQFLQSVDKSHEKHFAPKILILAKHFLNLPLTPEDIVDLAKEVGFTKLTYIREYPDLFRKQLQSVIQSVCGTVTPYVSGFLSEADWKVVPKVEQHIFANMSLISQTVTIPDISASARFRDAIHALLSATHESLKTEIAQRRKSGTITHPTVTPSRPSAKPPLRFDAKLEKQLLDSYRQNRNSIVDQHFDRNGLIDFYYRYRDLDPKEPLINGVIFSAAPGFNNFSSKHVQIRRFQVRFRA